MRSAANPLFGESHALSTFATLVHNIRAELLRRTDPARLAHVLGVEGMAVVLAKRWDIDPEAVLLAALLHDLAKPVPRHEQRERLSGCSCVLPTAEDLEHPAIWHGLLAAQEAHDVWGVRDRMVLEAVAYHPTGAPNLDPVGLAVYVADFIEPSRNWPGVEGVRREILGMDPMQAGLMVARMKVQHIQSKGRSVHSRTMAMATWLESTVGSPA